MLMARRRQQQQQTQLAGLDTPVIPPIPDAPGAEADRTVLKAHYRRVQEAFACHAYDDCVAVCRWCLAWEPLPFSEPHRHGGTRKYCSRRCADAYAAYKKKWYGAPSDSDETADDLPPDNDFLPEPSENEEATDTTDVGMQMG
jgi:hypothetical protein